MKGNTNFLQRFLPAILVGVLCAAQQIALADDSNVVETINALKQQIEVLDQKVRILESQRELDLEAESAGTNASPTVTIGEKGLAVSSGDGNFALKIHGIVQLDSRSFYQDGNNKGNDGFLLRRARPIIEGTVFHDFDYLFVPDFGGSSAVIQDAYLGYRYRPELQLRAGKFKEPVGLELLQSDANLLFNERSLVNNLIPNRDLGAQIFGEVWKGRLSYAAGIFNGVGDARNTSNIDFDDEKEFAGRLFLQPFKKTKSTALRGLGFGVGGSYGKTFTTTGLPNSGGFVTDGQQQFFAYTNGVVANGEHWRISPQGYYYYGPFSLLGEYALSSQAVKNGSATAQLDNRAWQVTLGYVLTGEDAGYNGVTPRRLFNPANGGWGAWQISARYAQLDIDNAAFPLFSDPAASASAAEAWAVGLNWWLNKDLRVLMSFSHTTFSGGGASASAPGLVTHQPENALFTTSTTGVLIGNN